MYLLLGAAEAVKITIVVCILSAKSHKNDNISPVGFGAAAGIYFFD